MATRRALPRVNRIAVNASGESCAKASFWTVKLVPQMRHTSSIAASWRRWRSEGRLTRALLPETAVDLASSSCDSRAMLAAVLLDLDGTLVATPQAIVDVTQRTLAELNLPPAD